MRLIVPTLILALWATLAPAQGKTEARYSVQFLGIHAGTLIVTGNESDNAYKSSARFATVGLVKAVKDRRFKLFAKGQINDGTLWPGVYTEDVDNGRRVTKMQIQFSRGVAVKVVGDPGSKAPPVDPKTIPGALDPLSVFYAITRNQPISTACRLSIDVYDGHRHAVLKLRKRKDTSSGISCSGAYVRKTGYTAKEMTRSPVPIRVDYVAMDDANMRVSRITLNTVHGTAVLHRQ